MIDYTPGPWMVANDINDPEKSGACIHCGWATIAVCDVSPRLPREEMQANARLIAAAPDLFAALEDIVARNEIQNWFNLDKARTALAKVKGE